MDSDTLLDLVRFLRRQVVTLRNDALQWERHVVELQSHLRRERRQHALDVAEAQGPLRAEVGKLKEQLRAAIRREQALEHRIKELAFPEGE